MRAASALLLASSVIVAAIVSPVVPSDWAAGAPGGFEASGFFRTELADGRWWLVTPTGEPFYSHGVNHVRPDPNTDRVTGRCPYCEAVSARYADDEDWSDATVDRLEGWGFNTIGAWSDLELLSDEMAYTDIVGIASGNDWFSEAFETTAHQRAQAKVAPRRDDPNLLGWFLDNELKWGRDFRSETTMLDDYLTLPVGSPGRTVAEQHIGDPSGFLTALANRYYQVGTEAVRAADPNHLILGNRLISFLTPQEVVAAAAGWLDVLSVNHYDVVENLIEGLNGLWGPFVPVDPSLTAFHQLSGLPVLVTEYSFRGADTEMPNTWPPIYLTGATQTDRADMWQRKVEGLYATAWIIGDHWFEWADQPVGGRLGDGEDNNFGLVSNADEPYEPLVTRMTAVHAMAPPFHVAPAAPPSEAPPRGAEPAVAPTFTG
jgi:hypothetical protein